MRLSCQAHNLFFQGLHVVGFLGEFRVESLETEAPGALPVSDQPGPGEGGLIGRHR